MTSGNKKTERDVVVYQAIGGEWAYGADIADAIGGRWWQTIYPSLVRLERDGMIVSQWEDEGGEFPRRRVYRRKGGVIGG